MSGEDPFRFVPPTLVIGSQQAAPLHPHAPPRRLLRRSGRAFRFGRSILVSAVGLVFLGRFALSGSAKNACGVSANGLAAFEVGYL